MTLLAAVAKVKHLIDNTLNEIFEADCIPLVHSERMRSDMRFPPQEGEFCC